MSAGAGPGPPHPYWFSNILTPAFFCSLSDAGALADPALEERGFPPDILMEEMIPTLKLVIRAVRSGTVDQNCCLPLLAVRRVTAYCGFRPVNQSLLGDRRSFKNKTLSMVH